MTLGTLRILAIFSILTSFIAQYHPRLFICDWARVGVDTPGVAAAYRVFAERF
jgi:hypothetical protein